MPNAKTKTTARTRGAKPPKAVRQRKPVVRRHTLLVDQRALRGAMDVLGTTNISETVNIALTRLAKNGAILRGLEEAAGSIPDFPYIET